MAEQSSPFLIFVILLLTTSSQSQNVDNNRVNDIDNEVEVEDQNPFQDVANAFMQNTPGGADFGGILSNILQADGGKTLGNLLMGATGNNNNDVANQILSGIGAMLGNNNAGAALDPSLIGNVLSLMANSGKQSEKSESDDTVTNLIGLVGSFLGSQQEKKRSNDYNPILDFVMEAFQQSGENPINLLTSLLDSFTGPDARKREDEHATHALLMPPLLEKVHLFFDHFRHTELYKTLWKVAGVDKVYNMFAVNGKFNFGKFFERLENKSFRRYWIQIITKKLTTIISVATDSKRQKKYVTTIVSLFNGFLKSANFPKSTLFDATRPTETLTNFFNYLLKKYLNLEEIDTKQYVKPAVKYVEEVLQLAQHKGHMIQGSLDSHELSNKLTDTINLEIIEPVARVYRAYRFAKREPECDKYVMCYINQDDRNEVLSLPGLKTSLSKTVSMVVSWFLSQQSGTSFWTLYSAIMNEKDCSIRFLEKCNKFHIEEEGVHTEYEHTEL